MLHCLTRALLTVGLCAAAQADVLLERAKLVPQPPTSREFFGSSVALQGDWACVGGPHSSSAHESTGSVAFYQRTGATWTELQRLFASDGDRGDAFGEAVALEGRWLAVGAPGAGAGAVYLFGHDGSAWSEQQKLVPADGLEGDRFGGAIALRGDTLVIGAWRADAGATDSGALYVFTRTGASWSQTQKLLASNQPPVAHSQYGTEIAFDGVTLLVGSWHLGYVDVWEKSGPSFAFAQALALPNAGASENFGVALAVEGDTALVGAPRDDEGAADAGSVFVFTHSGGAWNLQQTLGADLPRPGANFGSILALDGSLAIIRTSDWWEELDATGGVFVFAREDLTWSFLQKLGGADSEASDRFGDALALDGGRALIGAPHDSEPGVLYHGSAYVLELGSPPYAGFCDASDGALTACPCANPGQPDSGCDTAQATGGVRLDVFGLDLATGRAKLRATGFPVGGTPAGIAMWSDALEPLPVVFGDGLRCVAAPVVRFSVGQAQWGEVLHELEHTGAPGRFYYQLWYRNNPAAACTPAAFSMSNGVSIDWP